MRKLSLGLSFATMALLVACGSDPGTNANSNLLGDATNSSPESEGESVVPGSNSSPELDGESVAPGTNADSGFSINSSNSTSESDNEYDGDASIYDATANTLTDLRDGQVYRTTTIAPEGTGYSEVWMAENLNYEISNSWCGGRSGITTEGNCSVYGRQYTWFAAAITAAESGYCYGYDCRVSGTVRGVCPKGWHLPSQREWDELVAAVGGSSVAGKMLKSKTGWPSCSDVGDNTDAYLFSALPAGIRFSGGEFYGGNNYAYFWSSTEYETYYAYYMSLNFCDDSAELGDYVNVANMYDNGKDNAFSVRCLKD